MVYILDILKNKLVAAEIVSIKKKYIPLKKDGLYRPKKSLHYLSKN